VASFAVGLFAESVGADSAVGQAVGSFEDLSAAEQSATGSSAGFLDSVENSAVGSRSVAAEAVVVAVAAGSTD